MGFIPHVTCMWIEGSYAQAPEASVEMTAESAVEMTIEDLEAEVSTCKTCGGPERGYMLHTYGYRMVV